jgi:hypothetical protein
MSLISVKVAAVSETNYHFSMTSSIILASVFFSISTYKMNYANLTSLLTALNESGYRHSIIVLAIMRIR